jgi:hypothetical protein
MRASVRNGGIGLVRIHNVPAFVLGNETWFWGLAFEYQRPAGMSYGRTGSLEDAKFSHRLDPKLSLEWPTAANGARHPLAFCN